MGGWLSSALHEVRELLGKNEYVLTNAAAEFEDVFRILTVEVCPRCVSSQVSFLCQGFSPFVEARIDELRIVQFLQARS